MCTFCKLSIRLRPSTINVYDTSKSFYSIKLRYKQMEIFHQCFLHTPSNLSDFIECSFLLQSI